jgi:hypothetical protein
MRPPVLCALANGAARKTTSEGIAASKMLQRRKKRSFWKRARAFMTSPLAAKNFSQSHSSRLLCA